MSEPKLRFALSIAERNSAVWARLKAHLEDELQMRRERNDCAHDADTTARIRGEIGVIKQMLALERDEPIVE